MIFSNDHNLIKETVEVFRENAEATAHRDHTTRQAALSQFSAEFHSGKGAFDRLMDGVNRLPRPMLALGTIGLMAAAMVDPIWFAVRMQGIALVPEPLWWLLGIVVSFYFGGRAQLKSQEFHRGIAATLANAEQIRSNILDFENNQQKQGDSDDNPALLAWIRASGARGTSEDRDDGGEVTPAAAGRGGL